MGPLNEVQLQQIRNAALAVLGEWKTPYQPGGGSIPPEPLKIELCRAVVQLGDMLSDLEYRPAWPPANEAVTLIRKVAPHLKSWSIPYSKRMYLQATELIDKGYSVDEVRQIWGMRGQRVRDFLAIVWALTHSASEPAYPPSPSSAPSTLPAIENANVAIHDTDAAGGDSAWGA